MIAFVPLLSLVALLRVGSDVANQSVVGNAQVGCDSMDLQIRQFAVNALIANAPDRIPSVLGQLKQRTDACGGVLRLYILTQALQSSNQSGNSGPGLDGLQFARDLAASDPDTLVRQYAISTLAHDTTGAGVQALVQAARNAPTPELRHAALNILTSNHVTYADSTLRALYPQITSDSTKLHILRNMTPSDAGPWLLEVAVSDTEAFVVRREALKLALSVPYTGEGNGDSTSRGPRGVSTPALGTVYQKLTETPLRMEVVAALAARVDDDAAAQLLAQIASNDLDYTIRRNAVSGLESSHSKLAAQLLAEITAR